MHCLGISDINCLKMSKYVKGTDNNDLILFIQSVFEVVRTTWVPDLKAIPFFNAKSINIGQHFEIIHKKVT